MKGQSKDLRAARDDIRAVRAYVEAKFGFYPHLVEPLETNAADGPSTYCMFEACGIEYQVRDGRLSIYRQGGGDE